MFQDRYTNMNLQLEHKTAVVTGSTAGIGSAIASLLAREGVNVVVNSRSDKNAALTIRRNYVAICWIAIANEVT